MHIQKHKQPEQVENKHSTCEILPISHNHLTPWKIRNFLDSFIGVAAPMGSGPL